VEVAAVVCGRNDKSPTLDQGGGFFVCAGASWLEEDLQCPLGIEGFARTDGGVA
jgi:hypothetical protein